MIDTLIDITISLCRGLFYLAVLVFGLMIVAGFFVYLPRDMYIEGKCLEHGYPSHAVDWRLRGYCMNLQGTVSVAVDKVDSLSK